MTPNPSDGAARPQRREPGEDALLCRLGGSSDFQQTSSMSVPRSGSLLAARLIPAAASSLSRKPVAKRCTIEVASAMIPHPKKASTGGEDAWFISKTGFGVFDGVGGWSSKGIDAGEFSRTLAKRTSAHLDAQPVVKLACALNDALNEVLTDGTRGSCTACVARIDEAAGRLQALNLGDSGVRVFRPSPPTDIGSSDVLHLELESRAQQHYFNCPLQLGGGSTDRPHHGDNYTFDVLPGDLVIMATDGVLDNLFDAEIAQILTHGKEEHQERAAQNGDNDPASQACAGGGSAREMAERVAVRARRASMQSKRVTPFSLAARKEGYNHSGGKLDDVTVICVKVLAASTDNMQTAHAAPRSRL